MKYKVGDKVLIKTWEELEKEFGLTVFGDINYGTLGYCFSRGKEEELNKRILDRVIEIEKINNDEDDGNCYYMKEIGWCWTDNMIKELVSPEIFKPIISRFQILDIR